MDTSIKVVIGMVLALIVVLGLAATTDIIFSDSGGSIADSKDSLGQNLECIMSNKKEATDQCTERGDSETSGTSFQSKKGGIVEA